MAGAAAAALTRNRKRNGLTASSNLRSRHPWPQRKYPPAKRSLTEEPPCDWPLLVSIMACILLFLAGLTMFLEPFLGDHEASVKAYEDSMLHWASVARPALKSSNFSVTVLLPAGEAGQPTRLDAELELTDSESRRSRDVAEAANHEPLKATASLKIPCYYRDCQLVAATAAGEATPGKSWDASQILSSKGEAPRASFLLTATAANGKVASLSIPAAPLVFDKADRGPQAKQCLLGLPERGASRICHTAQRLTRLCVAVSLDETGSWQLHSSTKEARGYVSGKDKFGCDSKDLFNHDIYQTDPCWGPRPNSAICRRFGSNHTLEVTVRAWQDPLVTGMTPPRRQLDIFPELARQETLGATLMILGFLAGALPLWSSAQVQTHGADASEERTASEVKPL
eukprot:TRINITY_DN30023_c0_g2_i1.p1 TRINITY_DN30023_c0_g2~~TRINITY_DN30023_c0_g2_i1.p1  ORF type:complete len:412 (+),score=69.07 TRINITY_DN30023_c0_g2_i1:44-1237(+)